MASSTHWLTAWNPAEPLPEGAAEQLPALVAGAEAAIIPADVRAFAVAMDELAQWVERFGVIPLSENEAKRTAQIADVVRGYDAALSDLPADLLLAAVRKTIATHRFRNLPLPADIRAHAEDELAERKARLLRLKTAAIIAEREAKARDEYSAPRERTPEQIAAAAEMAAKVNRMEVAPKPVPKALGDLKPEETDRREAIRRVMAETKGFRRIPKPGERREGEVA